MAICHFCTGSFESEQGVKAHMKRCDLYLTDKRKRSAALGSLPKAAASPVATPPTHAISPVGAPDHSAPLREFEKAMSEILKKQDAPPTPQQQRRRILQAAKERVIDRYRAPSGQVTDSLRGAAKLAIERELASLPLEELPFEEVFEIAVAIRDGLYATAFTQQAREAERQHAEREKRHKDEVEALGAMLRADRRKKMFIQQANHQAHSFCREKAIIGLEHLSLLADVESRLYAFLTGDEPIMEGQAIVRSVVDGRFEEAKATLAAARAKADEQWREEVTAGMVLGAVVALVVLSLQYPAQTVAIFNWIEQIFGYTPGAEADAPNPEASKTTPPAPNAEVRPRSTRQRKYPVAPASSEPPWAPSAGPAQGHA